MPESLVQLPADSTGKKLRHRERTIGANTIYEPYVIAQSERVVSAEVMCSTWRTLGQGNMNLFSLENTAGSAVLVALRRLSVQMDATALLATVAPTIHTFRTTSMPGAGTVLAKTLFDTTTVTAANVVARGTAASHGGAATLLTGAAVPVTVAPWSQLTMRLHSLVGQVVMDDGNLIPALCDTTPLVIRANEAIVVQVLGTNPATNHWVVNAMWEEYTLP